MGYLANQENIERNTILRAIQIGTIVASFTLEDFSIDGLLRVSKLDVEHRLHDFARTLT